MMVRVELATMSRWYSVLDTVVISGDDVCCRVVFGTLVGVFSVMWSELLMASAISCLLWSSVYDVCGCAVWRRYINVCNCV